MFGLNLAQDSKTQKSFLKLLLIFINLTLKALADKLSDFYVKQGACCTLEINPTTITVKHWDMEVYGSWLLHFPFNNISITSN